MYIVAQAIPLLRVLLTTGGGSKASSQASARVSPREVSEAKVPDEGGFALVQLPSGKIVPADSEEGKPHVQPSKQGQTDLNIAQLSDQTVESSKSTQIQTMARASTLVTPQLTAQTVLADPEIDDEVHRLWEDMGLSRRAWSKSP